MLPQCTQREVIEADIIFVPMYVFVYNSLSRQHMSLQIFFVAKIKPLHCLQERMLPQCTQREVIEADIIFVPMYVFVYNSLSRQRMSLQIFLVAKIKPLHCLQERMLHQCTQREVIEADMFTVKPLQHFANYLSVELAESLQ